MSNLEKAARQAMDAIEAALDESVASNHVSCRAILTEQIDALRAALAQQAEPVADREKPIGWLYPEGVEALKAGGPWVAYGTKQDHSNIPIYGAVAQRSEPHDSESVEGPIPSLRHQRLHGWKTQQAEPMVPWYLSASSNAAPQQAEPVDIKALAARAGLPLAWISETGVIQWSQLERLVALAFPLHSSTKQAEPVVEPKEAAVEWLRRWANLDEGASTPWKHGYDAARNIVKIHLGAPQQAEPVADDETGNPSY